MTGFARPIIRLPWMLALMAVLSTPAQAQMWRWYDKNPGYQPNVLKNGSVVNFSSWAKALPELRVDGK